MNDIDLTDSYQACARRFEHRTHSPEVSLVLRLTASHTRVASRTCQTILLFALLTVRVHAGCSPFPFYTPT